MSKNKRDYYEVLGVTKSSTEVEIKKAYRKLAMEFHPDRNKAADAEAKFKEINEAYEILSDANKKAKYDQYGHAAFDQSQGFGGASGFSGFDFSGAGGFEDIFNSFFGGGSSNRPRKGHDYQGQVWVSFAESLVGKTIKQKVDKFEGGKKIKVDLDIKIPAGIRDGQSMAFRGYGGQGSNGGPEGDLLIQIRVSQHKYYVRENNDVHLEVPISAFDILLQKEIAVPSPWGISSIKLKANTKSGDKISIRNHGAPSLSTGQKGDLIIHIAIYVPEVSAREQVEIEKLVKKVPNKTYEKFLKEFDV